MRKPVVGDFVTITTPDGTVKAHVSQLLSAQFSWDGFDPPPTFGAINWGLTLYDSLDWKFMKDHE